MRRPLTAREREILDFLLSIEFRGVEELRRQVGVAEVTARMDCCPTIELEVRRQKAPRSSFDDYLAVEAETKDFGLADAESCFELLLFVRDGWLSSVELVHYGDDVSGLAEFPPPETFERPIAPDD
jgi:hypothetical protein